MVVEDSNLKLSWFIVDRIMWFEPSYILEGEGGREGGRGRERERENLKHYTSIATHIPAAISDREQTVLSS